MLANPDEDNEKFEVAGKVVETNADEKYVIIEISAEGSYGIGLGPDTPDTDSEEDGEDKTDAEKSASTLAASILVFLAIVF